MTTIFGAKIPFFRNLNGVMLLTDTTATRFDNSLVQTTKLYECPGRFMLGHAGISCPDTDYLIKEILDKNNTKKIKNKLTSGYFSEVANLSYKYQSGLELLFASRKELYHVKPNGSVNTVESGIPIGSGAPYAKKFIRDNHSYMMKNSTGKPEDWLKWLMKAMYTSWKQDYHTGGADMAIIFDNGYRIRSQRLPKCRCVEDVERIEHLVIEGFMKHARYANKNKNGGGILGSIYRGMQEFGGYEDEDDFDF